MTAPVAISPADFTYIRELVRKRAGIVLEDGKEYLVESRLSTLARREGLGTVADVVAKLRSAPSSDLTLVRAVTECMTTNETSFYRDIMPFDALRKNLLPELIARRSTEKSLSIWCAAASTGQEPYSVAMLLRESFPQLFTGTWRVSFVATDLSRDVLAKAKAGVYSQLEINRGLPAPLMVKYFKRRGADWEIDPAIRSMIDFRELNLTERWPPMPSLDLVMIRNVLIYFSTDTKREILGRIRGLMRPDGYLMLGGAETTLNIDEGYERMQIDRSGAYRRRLAA